MEEINDVLIFYIDDDGLQNKSSVTLLEIGDSHVRFKDKNNNIVIIPSHRLIKIKYKGDAQ